MLREYLPSLQLLRLGLFAVDQERLSRLARARARQSALLDNFSMKRQAFASESSLSSPTDASSSTPSDTPTCMLCFDKNSSRKSLGMVSFVSMCSIATVAHRFQSLSEDGNGHIFISDSLNSFEMIVVFAFYAIFSSRIFIRFCMSAVTELRRVFFFVHGID